MKKVKISIKGHQYYDNNDDEIEFITDGRFELDGTDYVISYDESDMTGLRGVTTTIRVTKDNLVTLHRGSPDSAMIFEHGKRNQCHYLVEGGRVIMTVGPSKVINKLSGAGGSLFVDYKLEVMGELMSKNNFLIKVENGGISNA